MDQLNNIPFLDGDDYSFLKKVFLTVLYHDVIEDVSKGYDKLCATMSNEKQDIAEKVIECILLLTKPVSGMTYKEYLKSIITSGNQCAITVKSCDVLDHVRRLDLIQDRKLKQRLKDKYQMWPILFCEYIGFSPLIAMPDNGKMA